SVAHLTLPAEGEAHGIRVVADTGAGSGRLDIRELSVGGQVLEQLQLGCDRLRLDAAGFGCAGRLEAAVPEADAAWAAAIDLSYANETRAFALELTGEGALAGLQLTAEGGAAGLTEARLGWADIRLAALPLAIPDLTLYGGTSAGEIVLDGASATVSGRACVADIAFDSSDGRLGAAGLGLCGDLAGRYAEGDGTVSLALAEPPTGEVLVDRFYLDLRTVEPELEATVTIAEQAPERLTARWRDATAGEARLDATGLDDPTSIAWRVDVTTLDLASAASTYLASALEAAGLASLRLEGRFGGTLVGRGTALAHATLELDGIGIEDGGGRGTVQGLSGLLDYDAEGDSADSSLTWAGASLYQLPIGAATVRFYVGGRSFQLLDPVRVDVLDGALDLRTLAVDGLDAETLAVDFEAELEPIALRPVSEALGWPPLNGTLSGTVPRVTLREGVLAMGGALELALFDGLVRAENLRVERLLGVLPTFAADLTLRDLDLQQMTGAFSFGEITGTIGGQVQGLRLLDWEPVAFDLVLVTPDRDPRRHRISQRAVDNLTSIGGGPSAVLSTTFLRFFEDFDYRGLGIRCRLQNNVCRMGGVGDAPNGGYYIVRGAGIPRIDVIGYSREVDFPQLLRRLQAATESGLPDID
ncbi:MAG: hypothetical protein AAGE01_12520, partial [Pseudomonadota bacterium]